MYDIRATAIDWHLRYNDHLSSEQPQRVPTRQGGLDPNETMRHSPRKTPWNELKGTYADDVVLVILPRQWWMTSLSGLAIETLKVFPRFDPNDQGNGPIMVAALSGVDDVDEVDHCRRFFLI